MISFCMRNLNIFFKDRAAVMLSFLAEIIIVLLYILFLRDNLLRSLSGSEDIELITDAWMVSGILAITSVTTTMGAYAVMVEDKMKRIDKDFITSPVNETGILGGYILCAVIIGIIMTLLLLMVSAAYIEIRYDRNIISGNEMKLLFVILLTTFANSSVVMFFVSFIRNSNALAAECTIIGALIGFLTGIYIPMGQMPEYVQAVVQCVPTAHGAVLFRRILTEDMIDESFSAGGSQGTEAFKEMMGVIFCRDGSVLTIRGSIIFIVITSVFLFFITMMFFYGRRKLNR